MERDLEGANFRLPKPDNANHVDQQMFASEFIDIVLDHKGLLY